MKARGLPPPRATLEGHGLDGIVIGGSAGSIDGLLHILPALPAGAPVPVLVVVHLSPLHPSALPSLFGRICALDVCEAVDKMVLEPGTVVVAPPDYHLLVERDGSIALSVEEPVHYSRPSIDLTFESARWAWGDRTLGILLSGANEDGAAGLAAIGAAGGLCWVQDPDTASASVMPAAGLRAAAGAQRLPVAEIARRIAGLRRAPVA